MVTLTPTSPTPAKAAPATVVAPSKEAEKKLELDRSIILEGTIDKVLAEFGKLHKEVAAFNQKLSFQHGVLKVRSNVSVVSLFPDWGKESMELSALKDSVKTNVEILRQGIARVQCELDLSERQWLRIEKRWTAGLFDCGTKPAVGIDNRMSQVLRVLTIRTPMPKKPTMYEFVTSIPEQIPHYVYPLPLIGPMICSEPPKRATKPGKPPCATFGSSTLDELIPMDKKFFSNLDKSIVNLSLLRDDVTLESWGLNPKLDKDFALRLCKTTSIRLVEIEKEYKAYEATIKDIEGDQKSSSPPPVYKPVVAETASEKWKMLASTKQDIEDVLTTLRKDFEITATEEAGTKLAEYIKDPQKELDMDELRKVIDIWGKVMTDMRFKDPTTLETYLNHYFELKRKWEGDVASARNRKNTEVAHLKTISSEIETRRRILEAAVKTVEDELEQARKKLVENDELAIAPLNLKKEPPVEFFKPLDNMLG